MKASSEADCECPCSFISCDFLFLMDLAYLKSLKIITRI